MRRLAFASLPAALAVLALAGCPEAAKPAGFSVALVTPGPVSDTAWNALGYDGLEKMRAAGIPGKHIEERDKNKFEDTVAACARGGANVVFAHGFEFQDVCENVGKKFPGTIFVISSGQRTFANGVPLKIRIEECCYLAGIAAGFATKTKKLGAVGGEEIPPVKDGFAAFGEGAKRADKSIELRTAYVGNWDNVTRGKEQTLSLLDVGCDIVIHNADHAGLGVIDAAKSRGVLAVGTNRNQNDMEGGATVLASATLDIPRAMLDVANAVKAGGFVPHDIVLDVKSGYVDLVLNEKLADRLPAEARKMIDEAKKEILSGKLVLGGK